MVLGIRTTELTEALTSAIVEGKERAKALGRPVLVSVDRPMGLEMAPLAAFASGRRLGLRRAFWARPEEDFWLVGIGNATTLALSSARPVEEARCLYLSLLDAAVVEGPRERGAGPVFMGGFRFDPQAPRSSLWSDFPDGLLLLPKLLFTWSGKRSWLTLNFLASHETDHVAQVEAVVEELGTLGTNSSYATCQPPIYRERRDSREGWTQRVQEALRAIEEGHLAKVVLARGVEVYARQSFSLEAALSHLSTTYPGCCVFAVDQGGAALVGATPEALVRLEEGKVKVTCLAGTVARGASPQEDREMGERLLNSAKERLEHATVVTMVAKALDGVCRELQWDRMPQVLPLRGVQHLATFFAGRLREAGDILQLVELLHPTPAVGGVPRESALEIIRQTEGDRGWYAAPVGWLDHWGQGEFGVAIRSALLRGTRATLFAGSGIVKGSDPEEEFRETELKLQPLLTALRGVEHGIPK